MRYFNSWSRKLATIPLGTFLIGWIIYLIGFTWLLAAWTRTGVSDEEEEEGDTAKQRREIVIIIVLLIFGAIILVGGVINAASSKIPSQIGASFLGAGSVIHFTLIGWLAYECVLNIFTDVHLSKPHFTLLVPKELEIRGLFQNGTTPPSPPFPPSENSPTPPVVLLLSGAVIQGPSWMIFMMCSVFFKYSRRKNNGRNHQPTSYDDNYSPSPKRRLPFTPGIARKLSIPLIVCSAVGWATLISRINFNSVVSDGILFIGPLLYVAALLQAGTPGSASTVMGVYACILSMIYVPFLGIALNEGVNQLQNCVNFDWYECEKDYRIELSGAVVSLIFWACVLALWPFYRHHPSTLSRRSGRSDEITGPILTFDDAQPLIENV